MFTWNPTIVQMIVYFVPSITGFVLIRRVIDCISITINHLLHSETQKTCSVVNNILVVSIR